MFKELGIISEETNDNAQAMIRWNVINGVSLTLTTSMSFITYSPGGDTMMTIIMKKVNLS